MAILNRASVGKKGIAALLLTFSCAVYFIGFHGPSKWAFLNDNPKQQLQGLIHVLHEYPEQGLPHMKHETLPLSPKALGVQKAISPAEWVEDILATEHKAPLVIFSKTYCPYSRRAKDLFEKYKVTPAPFIIEVDKRDDAMLIKAHLKRLTGRETFPNIILNGKSIGGADDLIPLHAHGKLRVLLEAAGLSVDKDAPSPKE